MKLIIFGATGTVGKELVQQAVEKGYEVTAFVRQPERMQIGNTPNLVVCKGDVLNVIDVKNAIKNQDVVLCALGDGNILTDGAITKHYKIGFDGNFKKLSLKISRADVADFMLQQIATSQYSKKAVSISN